MVDENKREQTALDTSLEDAQKEMINAEQKTENKNESQVKENLKHLKKEDTEYYLNKINAKGVPEEEKFSDIGLPDGTREYTGPLGHFQYDPNEFEIIFIKKPSDEYGDEISFPVLHYHGKETDGSKIKIPEGIEHIDFMFENTDIESAPEIPEGVVSAFATFHDCHSLTECNHDLPDSLEYAPFMFAECENLKYGPDSCGENMQNMDYMFVECAALQRPPHVHDNVKSMNGTYLDCISISELPEVPESVGQATNMTVGCTTLDNTMDQLEKDKWQDEYGEFKQTRRDRQTLGNHIGNIFSAWMETAALCKEGHYFGTAMFLTFLKREVVPNGEKKKSFNAGLEELSKSTQNETIKETLSAAAKEREQKQQQKKEELLAEDEAKFEAKHAEGMHHYEQPNHEKLFDGVKDAQSDLFLTYPTMESGPRDAYNEIIGLRSTLKAYTQQVLTDMQTGRVNTNSTSGISESGKKEYARFYRDHLQDQVEYLKEATYTIEHSDEDAQTKTAKLKGLRQLQSDQLKYLTDAIEEVDKKADLFNEGVKRDIDKLYNDMGYPSLFHTDWQREDSKKEKYDLPDWTDVSENEPTENQNDEQLE